ncbi:MFS general substrate transporter [Lecanosticta acicola]|uniref:MFS general substrate transporter n=1 Tax=Lecanosticta acicola TaxID=111012 RepID=A0AAI8Z1E7_9PEZI|nr:MFS general substrate transporter [Lecanosticta acicola]
MASPIDQSSDASQEKGSSPLHIENFGGDEKMSEQEKIEQVNATITREDVTLESFSHLDIKKILRKMDLRTVPVLTLLYLLSFLDRGNIGNAKIEGLPEDLGLTPTQYNLCLTVFFFTYSAFEVPSNMLLKKLRPSIWLPSIMVAWGIVVTLQGITQSYTGLLIARIFLGVAEAGLFPGVIYYNTMWYTRYEVQVRQAYFFSAASIAGAFSGLLAYGISFMDGVAGLRGWRWIFILEGMFTVVVAVVAFFTVHDFPETASFLTAEERAFVAYRLKYDTTTTGSEKLVPQNEAQTWTEAKKAFLDWQIWMSVLVYLGYATPLYGVSLFLPTIIKELGFSTTASQLLTVPPYIVASLLTILVAYAADKHRIRTPFILTCFAFQLLGFLICIAGNGKFGITYAGVFIAACAIYPTHPANLTWLSNNLSGSYKRAVGVALQISIGNLSGAMASNFYRQSDAPRYYLGHGLEIGFITMGIVAATIMIFTYKRINAKRAERVADGFEADAASVQELSEQGDRAPTFRYTL